jgi:hypothetical protein
VCPSSPFGLAVVQTLGLGEHAVHGTLKIHNMSGEGLFLSCPSHCALVNECQPQRRAFRVSWHLTRLLRLWEHSAHS